MPAPPQRVCLMPPMRDRLVGIVHVEGLRPARRVSTRPTTLTIPDGLPPPPHPRLIQCTKKQRNAVEAREMPGAGGEGIAYPRLEGTTLRLRCGHAALVGAQQPAPEWGGGKFKKRVGDLWLGTRVSMDSWRAKNPSPLRPLHPISDISGVVQQQPCRRVPIG